MNMKKQIIKRNFKLITTSFLTGMLFANGIIAGFGQGYQVPYNYNNYTPAYNQNYTPAYSTNYGQNNNMPPLQGRVVTVPSGISLPATSTTSISSEFLTVGDTVTAALNSGFYYGGGTVLPAGSIVEGNIVLAEKAGLAGKHGKLKIRFTNVITPAGQRIPISGKLATEDGTGLLVGGTTTEQITQAVKKSAIGAGLGAIMGTFMGPLSGGKVGKGAIYGSAVGGGLGLGKSIIDKGIDAIIPANSKVEIILEQPFTVNTNTNYGY
ncbi:MAG: hypothetical protein V2B14_05485 [bacterium]